MYKTENKIIENSISVKYVSKHQKHFEHKTDPRRVAQYPEVSIKGLNWDSWGNI